LFESRERLAAEVGGLLDAVRVAGDGRYACLFDAKALLFESTAPDEQGLWALRRFLEERRARILAIPGGLAAGGPSEDAFEGWDDDDFLLAFWNDRVGLVLACADAAGARERIAKPLRVLTDRLFRWEPTYRLDPQGRGLFLGRAKLDVIVVERPGPA
jgi:hypothetical protein